MEDLFDKTLKLNFELEILLDSSNIYIKFEYFI